MVFEKKIISIFIASLCNTASLAALPDLTITNNSPDQLVVPNDGKLNSIIVDTNNTDINHNLSIGNSTQPIQDLNVALGLDRDNEKGGGKVNLDIFANNATFNGHGINLSYTTTQTIPDNIIHAPIDGSAFTFHVNSLTVKGEKIKENGLFKKYQAFSVGNHSSITVNATGDVSLTGTHNNALYSDEYGKAEIHANNIFLTANGSGTFAPVVNVNDDGSVVLDAENNIIIENKYAGSSYGIQLGISGLVDMSAKKSITVIGNAEQKAIFLNQTAQGNPTATKNGKISLHADDILLSGSVYSSMKDKLQTNGIFLTATNKLDINAKVSDKGVVHSNDKGYINLSTNALSITNQSTNEKSLGIFTEKNGSKFDGHFETNAVITASTGILVNNGSEFALSGDATQNSLLTLNSSLSGFVSKGQSATIKNTSISVNLNKTDDLKDKWYSPVGTSGIAAIHAINNGKVNIHNTDATGKILNINVEANANTNYNSAVSELKTSGLSANLGDIDIKNFEKIVLNVKNTGDKATNYGLRSVSGNINLSEGIELLAVSVHEGSAIYSSSYSNMPVGNVNINAQAVQLSSTGNTGIGINANDDGCVAITAKQIINIDANKAISVESQKSTVTIDGHSTQQAALKGDWSINQGKADVKLGDQARVEGALTSTAGGTLDLTLAKDGTFKGSTATGILLKGKANLTFGENSQWLVTKDSTATALDFTGTTINFSRWEAPTTGTKANPDYRTVTTNTFKGNNNTLKMQIQLAQEDDRNKLTDQFEIKNKAEGSHIADILIDGRDVKDKYHSNNWLISQGADSNMTIVNKEGKNQYSGRGMVTTWGLAFVAMGEEDKLDTAEGLAQLVGNTTGKGEGKWYLVRNDEEIVDPSPDPKPEQPGPNAPTEIQQITNMGISATQALSFAAEIDDLRTRLGEVRYGAQDGAWVKAGYAKEHADGYNGRGFSQKTHDLHIGLDRLVAQQEDRSWLVGGALRYAKSDQEGFAAAMGGTGELEQYSAKLYATYMHEKGSYADFVLQTGRYAQDLSGLANDKVSAFSADYKTWGYGASVEVGHMFSFGNDVDDRRWTNHAFVEPQLQLSYFKANGKDYTTSTGMAVSQGDADFLTGRAGVVVGKKFNYGSANDLDKRYFQIALKGGVKYEFKGDQTIGFTGVEGVTKHFKADEMDGARYYYGLTTDWQLGDNLRAYATIEREEGDHYTKDIDATVGLKYAF